MGSFIGNINFFFLDMLQLEFALESVFNLNYNDFSYYK